MRPVSYLVSTAGHAQEQNDKHPHGVRSILQLVDEGAKEFGDEAVVGFTSAQEDGTWRCDRYTFGQVQALSDPLAADLVGAGVPNPSPDARIVGLLCPTGLDFLIAWIALMRMGYGVVLIAPQCSPSAIQSLMSASSATRLVYHPKYTQLAESAHSLDIHTPITTLPAVRSVDALGPIKGPPLDAPSIDRETISHVFHTSGTSGNPKPIPNTHYRSVAVLPRRALPSYLDRSTARTDQPPSEPAAYTTTPLFHGGVSDLLRAWMARSMIYFYPTSDMPITEHHVVASVESCQRPPSDLPSVALSPTQEQERRDRFEVKAFLSVPYILSVLAERVDGQGMRMLASMDYVSTGGAPLDSKIGDMMVDKGVPLVSRLGSSECGFLMSSHRDYTREKDWEWLRNDSSYADALVFEPSNEAGKYEMVVTDGWSSKTKSNRPDGSYATGDLYMPHPEKSDVWKYVGRGDDVIVMSNGEKASPGPIESTLRSSPLLSDALVVGADRDQLGVLLFLVDANHTDESLLEQLSKLIDEANRSSPSFAQVSTDMCCIIRSSSNDESRQLPKSSKGTIQRGVAYDTFKTDIDALYAGDPSVNTRKRSLQEIEGVVRHTIAGVTKDRVKPGTLGDETDLFAWGVDSLMATRIRGGLIKTLGLSTTSTPRNLVFDNPSIDRLSRYLHDLQEGVQTANGAASAHQLMRDLVKRYGQFAESSATQKSQAPAKTIILTGATGSLGCRILDLLNKSPTSEIERIVVLVRAENDASAKHRVEQALTERGLSADMSRCRALAADLSLSDLGLQEETYRMLSEGVDMIIHAAWPVHFASSLTSFEDNIKGTRHLLDMISTSASRSGSSLLFCSSLASVLAGSAGTVTETPSDEPSTASPIGYSQSKWVTERICRLANESQLLRGRVKVLRVGQLCGDTHTGHWNEKEGWPLMIRTAQATGCLPDIQEKPSWLPVDLAARAIYDLAIHDVSPSSPFIYHVAHPETIAWSTVLDGLRSAGMAFETVSADEWLRKVDQLDEGDPSRQMLDMWRAAYGDSRTAAEPIVDCSNAVQGSETMRSLKPLRRDDVKRMVQAWRWTGFLS